MLKLLPALLPLSAVPSPSWRVHRFLGGLPFVAKIYDEPVPAPAQRLKTGLLLEIVDLSMVRSPVMVSPALATNAAAPLSADQEPHVPVTLRRTYLMPLAYSRASTVIVFASFV